MAITKLFAGGPPIWDFDLKFTVAAGAPVSVETGRVYIMGMSGMNIDAALPGQLLITDTNGDEIVDQEVPPKGLFQPPAFDLMPTTGLKAGIAGGVTMKIRIWGYRGAAS